MVTKLIPLCNLNTTVFILAWQKKILETILDNRKVFKRNKMKEIDSCIFIIRMVSEFIRLSKY